MRCTSLDSCELKRTTPMMTYHHIRYAEAARMGEPQIVPYEEPGDEAPEAIACPQNEFRLGFVMGEGEPMAEATTEEAPRCPSWYHR